MVNICPPCKHTAIFFKQLYQIELKNSIPYTKGMQRMDAAMAQWFGCMFYTVQIIWDILYQWLLAPP